MGCGSSGRIIQLLIDQGYAVEGLDISSRMLELARKRHPTVTFHQADICTWTPAGAYDFISAWDSIWHVPLDQQAYVLRTLVHALAPEGIIIFSTGGVEEPAFVKDEAMGVPMYTAALGIPQVLQVLADAGCACRHLEYDQHPELHLYIIAQKLSA